MIVHDGTIRHIDRIALANSLYSIADGFMLETELWTLAPDARAEFQKNARMLSEIARGVLGGYADFAKAQAFDEAGRLQLGRAIAARRFFTSVNHKPKRKTQR